MPQRHRAPYAPEFRRQMIELVRAGRDPEQLAREFEPSAQPIRNWVAQADRDEGPPGRGPPRGWSDHARARGAAPSAAGEPPAARRARDPKKSRGLVRSGERV